MEQKISFNHLLQGILYVGGLFSLKFLLSTFDNTFVGFASLIISVISLLVLYNIVLNYRNSFFNGYINYWKSFKYIFILYFFSNIIVSIIMIIYSTINPEFSDFLANNTFKTYEAMKVEINDQIYDFITFITKPVPYGLTNLFASIFSAAFWAFILSFFIKKEKNIFE